MNIVRWTLGLMGMLTQALAFAAVDYSDLPSWTDTELKALKLRPVNVRPLESPHVEASGFVVGGPNATELLRSLTALNGLPVTALETSMRPGALSGAGFLGPEESLLAILAEDNDTILARNTSHRVVGFHLRVLGELGTLASHDDFLYRGERFAVERGDTHGLQESPFADGTHDGRNATVKNLRTGKSLAYALLVPRMIERYGFYEGHGTPYRVAPADAIELLGRVLDDAATTDALPGARLLFDDSTTAASAR